MSNQPEQLLISSVLRNRNMGDALKRNISARMFYIYPDEWQWIEDFYLKRTTTPSKAAFLSKFPNFRIKQADDTEYFSDEVREEHKKRSTMAAMSDVLDMVQNGDGDYLNTMFQHAMKISSDLGLVSDGDVFRDHADILHEFAMRKERYDLMGASGIPSGFPTFDERTGGFAPGEFWVFAARLGVGKSFSLQNMAINGSLAGYSCLYYALEQPRANVMARIVPLVSPRLGMKMFTTRNLIRGEGYDQIEFMEFMNNLQNKVKGNFHVQDGSGGRVSTAQVAAGIERIKPDIVYVDHLTLMQKKTADFAGVAEIADELDLLSKQYQIPIVSAAQLNRNGAQKGAGTETIAESDKIGQNASGIVFIEKSSKRVIKYTNQKSRNTEGGFGWWARFEPERGIFTEIDYDTAQELIEIDEMNDREAIADDK